VEFIARAAECGASPAPAGLPDHLTSQGVAMNRGDFGHTYLPKTLRVVSGGKFQVVNASDAALGTFAATAPAALTIAIPADVMDQLKDEGLVSAGAVALYNAALDPTTSFSNMSRYLSLLQRLAPADVNDGP
jgi:hypothetical protein